MKNELDIVSSTCITEGNIEGISVVLSINNKQYQVISIYCHPPAKTSEICAAVEKLQMNNLPLVTVGDLNIDLMQLPNAINYTTFWNRT